MSATLTTNLVTQIAALAQLDLTHDELVAFTPQLDAILEYARAVQTVDTAGVAPTTHVSATAPALRTDDREGSLAREDALQNAPGPAQGRYFTVPQVIGG